MLYTAKSEEKLHDLNLQLVLLRVHCQELPNKADTPLPHRLVDTLHLESGDAPEPVDDSLCNIAPTSQQKSLINPEDSIEIHLLKYLLLLECHLLFEVKATFLA